MRYLVGLFLTVGCAKATTESAPAEPPPAVRAVSADAAVDAADDAPPAPQELAYASLDEFLGLADTHPRAALAGFELGQPAAADYRRFTITGWGYGSSRPYVVGGRVTHVVVEIAADADSANYDPSRALPDVITRMTKAWGAPRGTHASWRGEQAQLFAIEYDGFLRGTPSLVLDVVPPGDEHACGARDGFAAFFSRFKKALVAKDEAALAKLTANEPDDDRLTDRPALSRLPPKPSCHLARETYYWRTVEEVHGGTYWTFSRDTTWVAHGPFFIGHDDDPNITAP